MALQMQGKHILRASRQKMMMIYDDPNFVLIRSYYN